MKGKPKMYTFSCVKKENNLKEENNVKNVADMNTYK